MWTTANSTGTRSIGFNAINIVMDSPVFTISRLMSSVADQIIQNYKLSDDSNLKQAVAAALIEKIFSKRSDKADSKAESKKLREQKIA